MERPIKQIKPKYTFLHYCPRRHRKVYNSFSKDTFEEALQAFEAKGFARSNIHEVKRKNKLLTLEEIL